MKNTLILALFLLLIGCSSDSNPEDGLPKETQIGANTFGVTIKGKVYIPRDPTGGDIGASGHGMVFLVAPDDVSWNELEVIDGASAIGFRIIIHIQNLKSIGTGQYQLKQSNFHKGIDSTPFTHIYFMIWDSTTSNYTYYGSIENQGILNITRSSNDIYSGNFSGKFVRYDNPNDFIQITDGRFDIGPGLHDKLFP